MSQVILPFAHEHTTLSCVIMSDSQLLLREHAIRSCMIVLFLCNIPL